MRRQLQLTEEYAARNGLTLEPLNFRDLGISAFNGKNVTEGALSAFIRGVKAGKIPRGSVLLVESLDRLSREQVRKAMRLLLELIDDHGIEIHTLADGKVYGEGTDFADRIFSLVIMSRANEESKTKSERCGAAWKAKKDGARTAPGIAITGKTPYWIRGKTGEKLELDPERAEVVREIFRLAKAGFGSAVIARSLDDREIKPFGRTKIWSQAYVDQQVLRNPATHGLYQPNVSVPGARRKPDGEPIRNYFPRVIEEELFLEVGKIRSARATRPGGSFGRSDKECRNLFSGLLIDAEANLGMVYVKRDSARAGEIITADKRSSSHRLPYAPLERAFLHFLDSLDWQSLLELPESKEEAELSKVGLERSEAERVLLKLEGFLDPDSKEPVPERFLAKMSEAEAALKTVLAREVSLSREVSATRSLMTRPEELRAEIEAGDIPLRFRVREEIRRRVSKISLTFRCRSLVVATIDFVNGARRLIGLWKSEPGDAEKAGLSKVPGVRPVPPDMLKEFAAELKGTPLEKGIVYFYSPYPPRERALKGAKRKAARS